MMIALRRPRRSLDIRLMPESAGRAIGRRFANVCAWIAFAYLLLEVLT